MRALFGAIIVLLGVGFLLQQLNIPWANHLMDAWWPFVIIAVGLAMWNGNRRHWFGPMIVVLVGIILYVDQLNVLKQSAWSLFWPVVVILVGGRILLGRQFTAHQMKLETGSADATAIFSGVERRVVGPFARADVSAWFGGVKLDLRDAQFADQSQLNISTGFGGVEIMLPRSVRVVTHVTPIMGGAEDKTTPDGGATKTLTITGSAMFGGIGLKN